MGGELGLAAEGIAGYSMPVNIATTQGESNIPTKSAAIRRLCIGNSSALPERGGAADPSRIGPLGHFPHSTSVVPLLHFCVSWEGVFWSSLIWRQTGAEQRCHKIEECQSI